MRYPRSVMAVMVKVNTRMGKVGSSESWCTKWELDRSYRIGHRLKSIRRVFLRGHELREDWSHRSQGGIVFCGDAPEPATDGSSDAAPSVLLCSTGAWKLSSSGSSAPVNSGWMSWGVLLHLLTAATRHVPYASTRLISCSAVAVDDPGRPGFSVDIRQKTLGYIDRTHLPHHP